MWLSGECQAEKGCRSRRGRDFVRDWAPYPDPSRKMGAGSSLALCSSNTNTISNPSPPPQSIYCHHCRYLISPARFPLLQHCCVRSNFYYLPSGHLAARDLMPIAISASHSPSTSPALPPLPPDTPRCAAPTSQRIHRQPAPLKGTAENPVRHNILTTMSLLNRFLQGGHLVWAQRLPRGAGPVRAQHQRPGRVSSLPG